VKITEQEFRKIIDGIFEDRETICRNNPIGSHEEILLWMAMCCLVSYLSVSEMETPCFPSKPDSETYRQAIGFLLSGRVVEDFDYLQYLEIFKSA